MSERQNAASYLKTSHLQADLGKRGARGAVVMMTSQGLKALLQIASTVVLARLLTPDDFGVIAMAATAMNFVMIFKDLGLSQATMQREHLTGSQVTTLFWLNVLFSVGLMLIVIALAPLIALFYDEPRLTEVTMALSVGFLLTGLSVQSEALLKRQMRFIPIAVVDFSATAIGFVAGIVSALLGIGYWALVVMRLAQQAAAPVGVALACGWRPGRPCWDPSAANLVRFGGHITGFSLLNYFSRNADNVLIGWYWGAAWRPLRTGVPPLYRTAERDQRTAGLRDGAYAEPAARQTGTIPPGLSGRHRENFHDHHAVGRICHRDLGLAHPVRVWRAMARRSTHLCIS